MATTKKTVSKKISKKGKEKILFELQPGQQFMFKGKNRFYTVENNVKTTCTYTGFNKTYKIANNIPVIAI